MGTSEIFVVAQSYNHDTGTFDRLLLVAQNIWGLRYIDDLIARRVQRGYDSGGWLAPDGSWDHAHLSVTLSDSMFSVRRNLVENGGDDWSSPSLSEWSQQRASLEIDYSAYGQPDPIVGLATDPWTDFPASGSTSGDGVIDFFDMQSFLALYSAQDIKADRNADGIWDIFDVTAYSADFAAGSQSLTPTGREDEEENPFGLAGYRHDRITGLYHVRNRVLDPEQGKWLQRDPAGFVDGNNFYSYAGDSPISHVDPNGLKTSTAGYFWETNKVGKKGHRVLELDTAVLEIWWQIDADPRKPPKANPRKYNSHVSTSKSYGRLTGVDVRFRYQPKDRKDECGICNEYEWWQRAQGLGGVWGTDSGFKGDGKHGGFPQTSYAKFNGYNNIQQSPSIYRQSAVLNDYPATARKLSRIPKQSGLRLQSIAVCINPRQIGVLRILAKVNWQVSITKDTSTNPDSVTVGFYMHTALLYE